MLGVGHDHPNQGYKEDKQPKPAHFSHPENEWEFNGFVHVTKPEAKKSKNRTNRHKYESCPG